MEDTQDQHDIRHDALESLKEKDAKKRTEWLAPFQYKKGQSGNPGGRPVGSVSMKTYVKNKLLSMTDEEREVFLEGIDKKTLWEMSEGKAKQDTEITGSLSISQVLDQLDDGPTPEGQDVENQSPL